MSTPAVLPVPVAEEEDITRHRAWGYHDDLDSPPARSSSSRKGKERESPYGLHDDSSTIELTATEEPTSSRTSSYPPVNDAQEESRRIQENLKRWEQAELQRRKAARQSSSGGGSGSAKSPSTSLADAVSRRSSLLWPVKRTGTHNHKSSGSASTLKAGSYAALPPSTDLLPLTSTAGLDNGFPPRSDSDEVITSSTPAHLTEKNTLKQPPEDDPFSPPHTEDQYLSPFADPPHTPGAEQTSALAHPEQSLDGQDDGKLDAAQYISRQPPPPRPLGLPPPKSPPPPLDHELYEDDGVVVDGNLGVQNNGTGRKTRWWHEWLCGCGEGPDRGGDHQAGRTNPFE